MSMIRIIVLCVVMMVICGPVVSAQGYSIAPGDIIDIQVWGQEEFSPKTDTRGYVIRPDGWIAVPLIGEVNTIGLTPSELTKKLTNDLAQYIKEPKITVNIIKYHTTRVYVLGEIAKPGLYELEKQHNVLDALSAAGGYTKNTAKKKVFIIRKDGGDPLTINLLKLLKQGDMSQNYELGEGDVVYLTNNGRVDFVTDILPFITATYYIKNAEK